MAATLIYSQKDPKQVIDVVVEDVDVLAGAVDMKERPAGRVPVAVTNDDKRSDNEQTTERATSSEATTQRATSSEATTQRATSSEATTQRATSSEATTQRATSSETTTQRATSSEVTTERTTNSEPKTQATTVKQVTTEATTHKEVSTEATTAKEHTKNTPVFCDIANGDALSAITRASTKACKNTIKNVTCLAQEGKLYNMDIPNLCPLGTNPGAVVESLSFSKDEGNSVRILFLLSLHGRSVRQVRRLFKAIYDSKHYYYIHVDSVSLVILILLCVYSNVL